MMIMYLYPVIERDMKHIEDLNELEVDERLDYDAYFILTYYVVCALCVSCATKGL